MSKFIIIYSSVHGQTLKVTNYLAEKLIEQGHQVTTATLEQAPALDEFDKVVLGASIRHGKHTPGLYDFITEQQTVLEQKATSFFSVSLVARKPAKNTAETNPYMQAFLAKTPWRPNLLEVFGGNLNYQGYNAMDRNIIRFIMWITKGPIDANTNVEYTDWQKVDRYAQQLMAL
ncbi:menaquinone-dependent protoporphyrinogen IX dehydrogenase [Shewanella waksmanii]|uniref:menaquinone-dependent protoporphyrinogen IX dehydrogenase n=1 Tax=Shewanella waksmanii TaxID=213783 RepID=UPI00048D7635|nr:menaquinone-dependent protoporphyrinogen IX dehydrogenase [Shewanella waksmanii]